jgi:hypothetical protein
MVVISEQNLHADYHMVDNPRLVLRLMSARQVEADTPACAQAPRPIRGLDWIRSFPDRTPDRYPNTLAQTVLPVFRASGAQSAASFRQYP